MEASGAADITTTVKPDSDSGTASEDVSLEVTSSAASSLSIWFGWDVQLWGFPCFVLKWRKGQEGHNGPV
jgi:hypothetical protein